MYLKWTTLLAGRGAASESGRYTTFARLRSELASSKKANSEPGIAYPPVSTNATKPMIAIFMTLVPSFAFPKSHHGSYAVKAAARPPHSKKLGHIAVVGLRQPPPTNCTIS